MGLVVIVTNEILNTAIMKCVNDFFEDIIWFQHIIIHKMVLIDVTGSKHGQKICLKIQGRPMDFI